MLLRPELKRLQIMPRYAFLPIHNNPPPRLGRSWHRIALSLIADPRAACCVVWLVHTAWSEWWWSRLARPATLTRSASAWSTSALSDSKRCTHCGMFLCAVPSLLVAGSLPSLASVACFVMTHRCQLTQRGCAVQHTQNTGTVRSHRFASQQLQAASLERAESKELKESKEAKEGKRSEGKR